MRLEKKQKSFTDKCGDWNYRNIDMTKPHLQSIQIIGNDILISCELFSPETDDYVSCDGGIINNKDLIIEFRQLDLNKKNNVLEFISTIENFINWNEVNKKLYDTVEKEKENIELEDEFEEFDVKIVPAERLGGGWNWHKYNDGSGYLESPDGKEYMSYDLDTNEYKETNNSRYEFFPLNYYYADGINPSEFKPFEYMETEMVDRILPKEKINEELSL